MYGLVLEGGGAKGSYQIGAFKALQELGIEISGAAGTSIGALNGAMIVQGDWEKAYDLWYNITPSRLFDINEEYLEDLFNFDINKENLGYFLERAKSIIGNRGLDISLIKKFLEENIDEAKIRKSHMDFGLITYSLTDFKPLEIFIEDLPEGKLLNYLLASAYLPAFKMERIEGKYFLDGGVFDNLPIQLLIAKGYKDIIAVRLNGMGRKRKIKTDDLNVYYLNPSEDLGTILDFSQKRARYNLELGYYDCLKLFKGLKGRKYYITPVHDEQYFLRLFLNLEEEKVIALAELLGFVNIPYPRVLLENVIPKLASLINVPSSAGYEDIFILLWEEVAQRCGLQRMQVYNFSVFYESIICLKKPLEGSRNFKIPEFLKRGDIFSRVIKDDIMDEVVNILIGERNVNIMK